MKKVSELYSPPIVTLEAQRRPALGISGLKAFDLSTAHPDGGKWNFNLKEHRELAIQICEKDDPDWLIGSPPHARTSASWGDGTTRGCTLRMSGEDSARLVGI